MPQFMTKSVLFIFKKLLILRIRNDEIEYDESGCDERLKGLNLEESIIKSKQIALQDTMSVVSDGLKTILTATEVTRRSVNLYDFKNINFFNLIVAEVIMI